MDKLEQIVAKQKELGERIIEERGLDWLKDNPNKMLKHHILALNDEVAELQREINFKWWVNEQKVDYCACGEELIDILHFTLQVLILLGADADWIYEEYMGKNKENHDRQDGNTDRKGYDVNSDEQYENVD